MKRYKSLITVGVILACWLVLLCKLYDKGKLPNALIYGRIPDQTVQYIEKLTQALDISVRFNPDIRPEDWQDKFNYGEDPKTGLKKIEDNYFIIYFNGDNKGAECAENTLRMAHEAIPDLTLLMGQYYYPADVNSRKLPIYLAGSQRQYTDIINIISDFNLSNKGPSMGMYISQYSRMGNLTVGIVLHPDIWKSQEQAKEVLWHEMNHYVYFTALQYDKVVRPYMWVYEGLAEYFSKKTSKLTEEQISKCMGYNLSGAFPDYIGNYWGGESVFRFMENSYGITGVKYFISLTYSGTIEESIQEAYNTDIDGLEQGWKNYLQDIDD